jgi:hypothetical protein
MKPITPAEAVKIIDEVFPPKESDPRENIPPAATLDDFGQADQGNADDDEVAGNDSGSGSGPRSGAQEEKRQERFTLTRFNAVRLASSPAYLVKGLIPRGGLTVVWGPPKCGKSFWTFDLTMHVALGEYYRGRRVQQGAVVYLALEGGQGFRARIEAYRREHGTADAPFYLVTDRTNLVRDRRALIGAIRAQIGETLPALVAIDTLNRSLAGSESKDEDMAAYIQAADAIREAFDCAVIIVHHCGVDGSRPRGHTSLTGAADAQIAVPRDTAGNIIATLEWMKDGCEGDVIPSRLDPVDLGHDEDGEPINSCVIVPVDNASTERPGTDKDARWSKSLRLLRQTLMNVLADHGKEQHPYPDGPVVRAVELETVRQEFYRSCLVEADTEAKKQAARRQAFHRATKAAQAASLIGARLVDGIELVWLTKPEPPIGPRGRDRP